MIWMKIKYRLAMIYRTMLFKLGFGNSLLENRYGERILVFHGIDKIGETKYNSRFISQTYFEELIIYFKQNYHLISIEDFYQKKFKKNVMNIALTFDDGYLNNFKYAIPILEKYQVPASFYITTIHKKKVFLWPDFLDLISFYTEKKEVLFDGKKFKKNSKKEFYSDQTTLKNYCKELNFEKLDLLFDLFQEDWEQIKEKSLEDYWKLMSKEEIKKTAINPMFKIGSHSLTHANLAAIPIEVAKAEILKSKKILEDEFQIPIEEFAFPFGTYTSELVEYCKEIKFSRILSVDYHSEKDKKDSFLKERFVINPHISKKHQIACLLKGNYF